MPKVVQEQTDGLKTQVGGYRERSKWDVQEKQNQPTNKTKQKNQEDKRIPDKITVLKYF